ncbi:hypothetical protein IQ268_09455, partial [Oculatella sp. LEGE 06141]|uniref:hypothetical protein n=1 Tax=Oculatella sp. LEGE 06141 TaxID=1828648 RepID=UPI0019F4F3E6
SAPTQPAVNEPPAAIEFGQPLPGQSLSTARPAEPTTVAVAPTATVLIPSGAVLRLRYPGEAALELSDNEARQEVLLLEQSIVDQAGAVIVPQGSEVLGRFETGQQGSKFIAQALSVGGRNLLLQAESDVLQGDRQVSNNNVLLNSALGAIAGTLLGGVGGGLVGGAAAGATTYLAAPQPAVIQPNQVVQIRVIEPLPRQ